MPASLPSYSDLQPPVIITLTINNTQPIELEAFVYAFTSIAKEFRDTLSGNPEYETDAQIFVKEIRSGSIVADLVPYVVSTFPLIASHAEHVGQAIDFLNKWSDRISKLANGIVPEKFGRPELKTFLQAVTAIANDPNGSSALEVATYEDGSRQVKAAFKFNSTQARAVTETIEAEFTRLNVNSQDLYNRVLMVFTRSDVGDAPRDKRSGERVVISAISDKSLPIIYGSELAEQRLKHEIREANDNIFKKAFNVDVSVEFKNSRPIVYRITNVYDVVDLQDDDLLSV